MTFNRQLRVLRSGKHLTQEAVAEAIGAARADISRWELGKDYPSEKQIKSFASCSPCRASSL